MRREEAGTVGAADRCVCFGSAFCVSFDDSLSSREPVSLARCFKTPKHESCSGVICFLGYIISENCLLLRKNFWHRVICFFCLLVVTGHCYASNLSMQKHQRARKNNHLPNFLLLFVCLSWNKVDSEVTCLQSFAIHRSKVRKCRIMAAVL